MASFGISIGKREVPGREARPDLKHIGGREARPGLKHFGGREGRLGLKYAGCSLVGFAVDAALLHILVWAGMEAAWARVISLTCAMQVTFVINGLHVFRCLTLRELPRQWLGYMLSNGFGNFCNYWIFVTLVSLHWAVVSNHMFALTVAALTAWVMNYCATRFLVFRRRRREDAAG